MSKFKVEHKFDPFELVGRSKADFAQDDAEEILDRVKDYVVETILGDCANSRSPVTGRPFKQLSKEYRAHKVTEGLPGKADLTFSGEMLDAIKAEVVRGGKVKVFIEDDEQAAKAHGHINGSGNLPPRPFIPAEGESFVSRSIKDGIEEIMRDYPSGNKGDG